MDLENSVDYLQVCAYKLCINVYFIIPHTTVLFKIMCIVYVNTKMLPFCHELILAFFLWDTVQCGDKLRIEVKNQILKMNS